ncbi:AlkZ family DNA glycosylase [Natronosporangium hydrolyticum]|uniref:AlkZ family DNA glycosylase n=2 Tax=Natronosporangium hydrolyticum TaxID=2811111 RepID=A0A895YTQ3_9ACTN|nr:AlkZ family DNA glycosylase [Natronosporangium hydrolyticum]
MQPHLTAGQLNRATLARQLLLERHDLHPVEAVRRIAAIQAQAPASPYLALWTRLRGFDPAELDAAITDARLVKATLMRITLHLVHAEDYPPLHTAMQPTLRAARLGDRRYVETGLAAADADALVPDLVAQLATPHTNDQAQTWVEQRLGPPAQWAWWALRHYAPVRHHPNGGPWSFGHRPTFVAAGSRPPRPYDVAESDAALQTLARRYLAGFGPASVADVAQFALVPRRRARAALTGLGDGLVRYSGPAGAELFDLPAAELPAGALPPAEQPAPPRLLPMWDSTLLAYHDRSRILPERLRRVVIRNNGDVLPTVLVDGQVAGVWRTVPAGDQLGVEVTAFTALAPAHWEALAAEAASLLALLAERDPTAYRRYARWWEQLPEVTEVRTLPAGG